MEWAQALDHAKDVRLLLQPACERIEIAGSLRRLRAEVNDIELVAQPKMQPFDMLNERLADLVAHRWLYPGPASKNMKRPPMGPRYYRLAIPIGGAGDRLQLDIFAVLPAQCLRCGAVFKESNDIHGTSPRYGTSTQSVLETYGKGASQERYQERQSPGKPRDSTGDATFGRSSLPHVWETNLEVR